MEELKKCIVKKVIFNNGKGFMIIACERKVKNAIWGYDHEEFVAKGILNEVTEGSKLDLSGEWVNDSKYGMQFSVKHCEITLPSSNRGIEKYLSSGLIKGIGPTTAKKIVDMFGSKTFDILDNEPDRLKEINGIGKKKIEQIIEGWTKHRSLKNIITVLEEHDISTNIAIKIYKKYGDKSLEVLKENPYRLSEDIWGIGFKTADKLAVSIGFEKENPIRIQKGIEYTYQYLYCDGHIYAERNQLIQKATKLLEVNEKIVSETIDKMIETETLILETEIEKLSGEVVEALYLPTAYEQEYAIAENLVKLAISKPNDNLSGFLEQLKESYGPEATIDIKSIERSLNKKYDEVQGQAIITAAESKVMVLTGGPGTGKTTTTQGIIEVFLKSNLEVLLAAPTGRAAKRMSEATGFEASTIHRLLEYNPEGGFNRNEENQLEGDVLILDECSMVDMELMYNLLLAIPENMRFILIGDINQLPSVGAGNVLKDIIASNVIPVVKLTKIYRQSEDSYIALNADAINHGETPTIKNKDTDFYFITAQSSEDTANKIVDLVSNKLANYYNVYPTDIQVLAPMKKGSAGTLNLNVKLQEAINPEKDEKGIVKNFVMNNGVIIREGDKVMQIRNNYEKGIFNGDVGMVTDIDLEEGIVIVKYDKYITYEISELDEIIHAYASTIHKSQGSEYPIVVVPILKDFYVMLQRNILYTAITRAKQVFVFVGDKEAMQIAINNISAARRNTLLAEKIRIIGYSYEVPLLNTGT